jgi:hypothetical protein
MDVGGTPFAALFRRISLQGRELLLQREAERRARALDPERARRIADCIEAADRRLRFAGDVPRPDLALPTTILLRDAAVLLLEAASAPPDRPAGGEPDTIDLKAEFHRACAKLDIPSSTRDEGWRLLAAADPRALDAIEAEHLSRAARALESIVWALRSHLDGRSVGRIVWSRRARVSSAALFLVAVVVWTIRALFMPTNIARGKPVTLSALDPRGAPVSALVDGVRSGDVSPGSPRSEVVQSKVDPAPFALIDLGAPHVLREIRVYNRDDGYFDEGLPYAIDLSADGQTFTEVAHRTTHFGSWWIDPPWIAPLQKQTARFVRVRATTYLALSEVEVFAW